ncbi:MULTISPECIES: BlaI/MecI/CopY family transcriptional regulator [unclassified Frankia]|uniref:BlaI/MecI/CopY family transcriptional regulator n=1 Tax=unclassified Frankia TaxID=2632575 RepID=UPI0027DBC4B0|nr:MULTISPECIES: BlaI/MecI/CopY family transcriptional regulator [unclassified Frankia]
MSSTWARDGKRANGALETEVLSALWAASGPLPVAAVVDALNDGLPAGAPRLAHTTVLTTLSRLLDKGLVTRQKAGRGHQYAPARGPADLAAEQMRGALAAGADRAAVLARFVAGLDPADELVLRRLVAGDGQG